MQRILGPIAIFAGWLSMAIGAVAGLIYSQFFGLSYVEGPVPPSAVYGISGPVVLWLFAAAAVLLAAPLASAAAEADPRRGLRVLAAVMAATCLALFPDELGRVFGLPLLIGAICFWFGSEAIYYNSLRAATAGSQPTGASLGTAAADVGGSPDLAQDAGRDGFAAPGTPATPGSIQADTTVAPQSRAPQVEAAQPHDQLEALDSSTTRETRQGCVCPWCSSEVPPDAERCPNCRASLQATPDSAMAIPGVTEVSPNLRRYAEEANRRKHRPSLLQMMFSDGAIQTPSDAPPPSDAAALRPPSRELKAEIARLDAEIAAGALSLGGDAPDRLAVAGSSGGTTAAAGDATAATGGVTAAEGDATAAEGGTTAAEGGTTAAATPVIPSGSSPAGRTRRARGSGPRT